jgi:hypothetical protein
LVNGGLEKETTDVPPTDTLETEETSASDSHSQKSDTYTMRIKYMEKSWN